MNQEALLRQRSRTHAIVEGALLGDIAVVFLLMRAYLPILFIRPVFAAVATVPIALLLHRRGLGLTVLAGIASFILFSALVGPLLALAVVNVLVAGCLIGLGRRARFGVLLNTLVMGPAYAVLDILVPTVISIYLFRIPVKDLVKSAQNAVKLFFRFFRWLAGERGTLPSPSGQIHGLAQHWQIVLVGVLVVVILMIPGDRLSQMSAGEALRMAGRQMVENVRGILITLAVLVVLLVTVEAVGHFHASAGTVHTFRDWQHWAVVYWQVPFVVLVIFQGSLLIYLAALITEMVLKRLPPETLVRQQAN